MLRSLLLSLAAAFLAASPAAAVSFGFECVTGNAKKCATGEAQLGLDVQDAGSGQVSFVLTNSGGGKLTATNLYVDDDSGALDDLASVLDGLGVEFEPGGNPTNLKGGKKIGFLANFAATAVKPGSEFGMKPGDVVTLLFDLSDGATFQDVIDAIEAGDLRIGLSASKGFVNVSEGGSVPEPATLALLALGAGAVWAARRRVTA
jgi:hypothetical protein